MRIPIWQILFALGLSLATAGPSICQTPNETTDQERTAHCGRTDTDRIAIEWSISGDFIEHDPDADRFKESFVTELDKSDFLYWWGCDSYRLPKDAVLVHLVSTQVKDDRGDIIGTAIVATASRRSPKDPLAEIPIDTTHW